jgi:ectoine hydroxylase
MSTLDEAQLAQFERDGFYIARNFYDAEEIGLLGRAARADNALDERSFDRDDGEGGRVRLTVWNQPGDNVYGMYARGRRIVDSMEAILGGEVYHYHSKMILKDPRDGGAWTWHQDYGYWYFNGCLYPLMASVAIAVDAATRENGCMQVLKGSHHMGRVEHVLRGEQTGADTERVEEAKKRLELVYCEMEPGDALFFHSNLLHRSDQNKSEKARWSLICCYNAARNDPYKTAQHPNYTPLHKVEDSAIKDVGMRRFAAEDDVAWLDPDYAMKKRRKELEANK